MPWNGQIMEGVIDLIYERNGLLYLADYKTDRIERQGNCIKAPSAIASRRKFISKRQRQSLRREVAAFKVDFFTTGRSDRDRDRKE